MVIDGGVDEKLDVRGFGLEACMHNGREIVLPDW